MDKQSAALPGPWSGMLVCAAIVTAGFLATARLAGVFLPPPSDGAAAAQPELVLLP